MDNLFNGEGCKVLARMLISCIVKFEKCVLICTALSSIGLDGVCATDRVELLRTGSSCLAVLEVFFVREFERGMAYRSISILCW